MENWKPVAGYEGIYEVSDLGNVRRIARGRGTRLGHNRKLVPRNGYLQVILSRDNAVKLMWVHRLVAIAFHGDPGSLFEVNHKNGNKADARANNLEWVTSSGNVNHAYRTGLRVPAPSPGSKNGFSKLTESNIRDIRRRRTSGETLVAIAKDYGVVHSCISRACRNGWKHVE